MVLRLHHRIDHEPPHRGIDESDDEGGTGGISSSRLPSGRLAVGDADAAMEPTHSCEHCTAD